MQFKNKNIHLLNYLYPVIYIWNIYIYSNWVFIFYIYILNMYSFQKIKLSRIQERKINFETFQTLLRKYLEKFVSLSMMKLCIWFKSNHRCAFLLHFFGTFRLWLQGITRHSIFFIALLFENNVIILSECMSIHIA